MVNLKDKLNCIYMVVQSGTTVTRHFYKVYNPLDKKKYTHYAMTIEQLYHVNRYQKHLTLYTI